MFRLFILILLGCSKKVIGSRWQIEVDSTYSEAYVNKDEWVINHLDFGPFSYKYNFYYDSICIGDKKWAVEFTDTSLVLNNQNEKFILHKLSLKESVFESRKDSLAFENFQEDFMRRALGKSKIERLIRYDKLRF